MAQDSVVEFEGVLQFSHDSLTRFNIDTQIVCFGELVDLVHQLAPAPVFNAMNKRDPSGFVLAQLKPSVALPGKGSHHAATT